MKKSEKEKALDIEVICKAVRIYRAGKNIEITAKEEELRQLKHQMKQETDVIIKRECEKRDTPTKLITNILCI